MVLTTAKKRESNPKGKDLKRQHLQKKKQQRRKERRGVENVRGLFGGKSR